MMRSRALGSACPPRGTRRLCCGLLMRGQRERSSRPGVGPPALSGQQPPDVGPAQLRDSLGLLSSQHFAGAAPRSGGRAVALERRLLQVRVGLGVLCVTARARPRSAHESAAHGGPGPAGGCGRGVHLEEVAKGLSV